MERTWRGWREGLGLTLISGSFQFGGMALLVRVDNKSNANYRLARSQITALLNRESLPILEGRDAAEQAAAKDFGGRALGWTLATGPLAVIFAPLTLVASSAHTNSINQKIGQHFGEIEFPDALVRRSESVSGFVYFKLPFRLQRLENLTVQIEPVNDATEQKLSYRFNLPGLRHRAALFNARQENQR